MKHEIKTQYNMIARIGAIICVSIIIVDSNDKVLTTICGIAIGMTCMLIIDSIIKKNEGNKKTNEGNKKNSN